MNIESEFAAEFHILKIHGRLVDDWSNVYEHCKIEGYVALILCELLGLNVHDGEQLIKAAILHDWYKRNEREKANEFGVSAYYTTEQESKEGLKILGVEYRIIQIAHSVGSNELYEVEKYDLLRRAMHFIDDICTGSEIVEIDSRIDTLESLPRYKEHNEKGREIYNGRTLFEVQREVGKSNQAFIEQAARVTNIVQIIKSEYDKLTSPIV